MPTFRIYRLKDVPYQQFRWAPHTSGATQVKRKDYEEAGQVEASSAYDAWTALRDSERPLRVGDVLETEERVLRIYKYVGFEEASWVVLEAKPAPDAPAPRPDPHPQPG